MTSLIRSCMLINRTYPVLKSAVPIPVIYAMLIGLLCWFVSDTLFAAPLLQDHANVVSKDMAEKLEKELANIEAKDGLHFEVVILPNFYQRQPEAVLNAYIEQLAKNAPSTDKSVLLFIVLDNKIAVIRPSASIAAAYDAQVATEVTDNVKKNIDEKNYDEMARIGIAGIYHYFQKQFPSAQEPSSAWKRFMNLGIILVVLVMVIFLITAMQKKKKNPPQ